MVILEALKGQMIEGEYIRDTRLPHVGPKRVHIGVALDNSVHKVREVHLDCLPNHLKEIFLSLFVKAPHRTKLSESFIPSGNFGKETGDNHCRKDDPPLRSEYVLFANFPCNKRT